MSLEIDDEGCPLAYDALNLNFASHLLNDIFADGQPESSSLAVSLGILIKLAKVYE